MELTYALLAGLSVAVASLSGVVFAHKSAASFFTKHHHYLLAFSLGVLCMTLYSLFGEGVEHFEHTPQYFMIGAAAGALLLFFGTRLHPHHHHATHVHGDGHEHSRIDGRNILISDGVHNISDGLILYPAFLVSPVVGIATAIGVLVHEMVQEIAEFFVLKEAGYTTREALLRNFLTACTIFIGIFLAFTGGMAESIAPWLFAVSFGAFFYLIVFDIIPCVFGHQKNIRSMLPYITVTLLGAALMFTIQTVFSHGHEADTGHTAEHIETYDTH